jgi:diaminopimelate epimerase
MINFQKYHGTGNDFIMIDDRNSTVNPDSFTIRKLCDRHFGIGADGLILIRPSDGYDFEMLYYNSDGNRSSMCGNGGRCSVAFAAESGLTGSHVSFLAFDGPHEAKILSRTPYLISLHMSDVESIEINPAFMFLNTGSPHYVAVRNDVAEMDVYGEGRKIRYSERFSKDGTNVNFIHPQHGDLYVRTYERGVEGETLSCGTGVTASVLAAAESGLITDSPGAVTTPGGRLSVYFTREGKSYRNIWLEGEAVCVFSGQIEL